MRRTNEVVQRGDVLGDEPAELLARVAVDGPRREPQRVARDGAPQPRLEARLADVGDE